MQVQLTGGFEEVWPALAAAIEAAGFEATAVENRSWSLEAREGDCRAWMEISQSTGSPVLTVWLPDEGDTAARERLVKALENCHCGDATPDEGLLRRLRRIEGQIRGLQRMIETGRECDSVLTQFSAVNAALKQTAALMVSAHLVQCIRAELDSGGDGMAVNQRLLNILF